jgi:hypothetical protein
VKKSEVLAFARTAVVNGRTVRITVNGKPYKYIGRVVRIYDKSNDIQIYGTIHGFPVEKPRAEHYTVRVSSKITIAYDESDADARGVV